jgi:Restriction endonuclease
MKKSDWPQLFESIKPFLEDAARTHYEGDLEEGFKFGAVGQVLLDMGLSDDAIKTPLQLDGRGDLGIDGYYEDEDAEALILVQSKFHEKPTTIGNDDLNRFFSVLRKVLDPNVVVASKNPLANDARRAAADAIAKG